VVEDVRLLTLDAFVSSKEVEDVGAGSHRRRRRNGGDDGKSRFPTNGEFPGRVLRRGRSGRQDGAFRGSDLSAVARGDGIDWRKLELGFRVVLVCEEKQRERREAGEKEACVRTRCALS
jgi:hypothetical protein